MRSRKRSNPRWDADADSIRDRLDGSVAALGDELAAARAAGEVLQAQELEELPRRGAWVPGAARGGRSRDLLQGEGPPPDPVRHTRPRRAELGLRRAEPILRANLTLRSSAFRHAIRLGLTVAVAAGMQRRVTAFLFANYGLFTLSITAFIIFFVAYAGVHDEFATAVDRLLDTTIGATITLGIYALWPAWERALLADTAVDLIEADRVYVNALLGSWFDGGKGRDAVARARARLARTNTRPRFSARCSNRRSGARSSAPIGRPES